jgi:hypothetical protein
MLRTACQDGDVVKRSVGYGEIGAAVLVEVCDDKGEVFRAAVEVEIEDNRFEEGGRAGGIAQDADGAGGGSIGQNEIVAAIEVHILQRDGRWRFAAQVVHGDLRGESERAAGGTVEQNTDELCDAMSHGEVETAVAYIELPPVTDSALGAQPSPGAAPLLAMIERTEEVCFRRRVRSLLSTDRVRVCFDKGWGRSDAHLIEMARKERADLIVVGMSERHGLSRIAHHSVSRAIVRYAPMNVVCIPSADPSTR